MNKVAFLARVYGQSAPYVGVHIPVHIMKQLDLRVGDHVHVIITNFPELPVDFIISLGDRKRELSLAELVEAYQEWKRENAP